MNTSRLCRLRVFTFQNKKSITSYLNYLALWSCGLPLPLHQNIFGFAVFLFLSTWGFCYANLTRAPPSPPLLHRFWNWAALCLGPGIKCPDGDDRLDFTVFCFRSVNFERLVVRPTNINTDGVCVYVVVGFFLFWFYCICFVCWAKLWYMILPDNNFSNLIGKYYVKCSYYSL